MVGCHKGWGAHIAKGGVPMKGGVPVRVGFLGRCVARLKRGRAPKLLRHGHPRGDGESIRDEGSLLE